jgi:glutaconyl-CoA/methylmalonyl-CoA decarboxylase subunit gamma
MQAEQGTAGAGSRKYVATIGDEVFSLAIDQGGGVVFNDIPHPAHLEPVDGDKLFSLLVGNRSFEIYVERDKETYFITVEGDRFAVRVTDQALWQPDRPKVEILLQGGGTAVRSPLAGVLAEIRVSEGQAVTAGQVVAILEAMKMENAVQAPCAGTVDQIHVVPGQSVSIDDLLMSIQAG